MRLIALFASFPLLIGATATPAGTAETAPTTRTVCELKTMAAHGRHGTYFVSITAAAHYDFEYGYFLQDYGCVDPVDGTGLLDIALPTGSRLDGFPELAKLSSQTWIAGAVGKVPRCTCIGIVSFEQGNVTFTLKEAVIRASD
ncbi:hypothetical protein [Sphingobium sp. YR768]|uniref:hypothetical protein n=1 Tax=Sphingobium sp. YR768 TaxID=1884365 RepID=UPI000B83D43A|nr:hypothetical protein [Sphingobium sp. YR768]